MCDYNGMYDNGIYKSALVPSTPNGKFLQQKPRLRNRGINHCVEQGGKIHIHVFKSQDFKRRKNTEKLLSLEGIHLLSYPKILWVLPKVYFIVCPIAHDLGHIQKLDFAVSEMIY